MKTRLDDIDHKIMEFKSYVHEATAKSSFVDLGGFSTATLMANEATETGTKTLHHLVNDQHYGTSSLASLVSEINSLLEAQPDRIKDSIDSDSISSDEAIQESNSALQKIARALAAQDCLDLCGEDLPLALPPKGLLLATLDSYFDQPNLVLPLFSKDSFDESVRRIYATAPDQIENAWIMCFNNVILQTLSVESLEFMNETDDLGEAVRGEATETELLKPLIMNFRRGLSKLGSFVDPKLVNVQALISMCLIAQENLQYRLASLLLHQACFVAKSMGLHQRSSLINQQTSKEASERNDTFWVLYLVDKTVSLTMGQSCCLPMYDCDISTPTQVLGSALRNLFVARIELAAIQEDVYHILYSRPSSIQAQSRGSSIAQLDRRLALIAGKYGDLREEVQNDAHPAANSLSFHACSSTALGYYSHMTRALIHHASALPSDQQQCRNDAGACIRLLQRLSVNKVPAITAVLLRQICRDQPLMPFFILYAHIIQDPRSDQSRQDTHLMATAAEILQRNQRFDGARQCVSQLRACSQSAAAFVREANASTSTPNSLSRPLSSTPIKINNDPFHAFTDLTVRKRKAVTPASEGTPPTNIALSSTFPEYVFPSTSSNNGRFNFDFTNPDFHPMTIGGDLGAINSHFAQPSQPSHLQQQQQQLQPQPGSAYSTGMAPQPAPRWPNEMGMGYFADGYVGYWPEPPEQT